MMRTSIATTDHPLRVFTAFSGYDSQCLALDRLRRDDPAFAYELVGWSEIEPAAIAAHNALYPQWADRNLGDISQVDWAKAPDFDLFTYSFPCFVAGTLINTERGLIPIEEITTADSVLTHTNQYRKVLAVGKRSGAEIVKVRAMCFDAIQCTPNHPFYARRRYHYGHNAERRFTDPEWLAAESLTKDHYLGYAVNTKSELPQWNGVTLGRWRKPSNAIAPMLGKEEFWYLMGRYVGDGWKRNGKLSCGIVICCSDRNRQSLYETIAALGLRCTASNERTVEKVIISSKELNLFVGRYGYYAHGKRIDAETMNLPVPLLRSFIKGYCDADGCFSQNEHKAISVSRELMYGIQQCIVKAYRCPVRMYYCKSKPTTTIEGRTVRQRDTYSLAWHVGRRKQDKAFYEDGYVWFPINSIERTGETATVYNMEVEADNSYTANGAIVHNCQDVSTAGRQRGLSQGSGSRSSLLWECEKAIAAKRPRFLLMENVKALLQKKFAADFGAWRDALAALGYANFWQVLNAKDYGVPQNRERVFMVSILDPDAAYHFPEPFPLVPRLRDVLGPEVDESYYLSPEQTARIVAHCQRKLAEGCGFKQQYVQEEDVCPTVTSKYGSRETDPLLKLPIDR